MDPQKIAGLTSSLSRVGCMAEFHRSRLAISRTGGQNRNMPVAVRCRPEERSARVLESAHHLWLEAYAGRGSEDETVDVIFDNTPYSNPSV